MCPGHIRMESGCRPDPPAYRLVYRIDILIIRHHKPAACPLQMLAYYRLSFSCTSWTASCHQHQQLPSDLRIRL